MESGRRRLRSCFARMSPGGRGSPSVPTTRGCLEWLGGAGTRAAKAVRDTRGLIPFGPSPVSTVPKARDATVERREASVLRKARGAFARCQNC